METATRLLEGLIIDPNIMAIKIRKSVVTVVVAMHHISEAMTEERGDRVGLLHHDLLDKTPEGPKMKVLVLLRHLKMLMATVDHLMDIAIKRSK